MSTGLETLEPATACALPPEHRDGVIAPSAAKSVLVLEDDVFFKDAIRDFLGENGYSVVVVQGGLEGIFEVQARDFDFVICDMMMPSMPGDEFFRAVQEVRPGLCDRFIFMTGLNGNAEADEFIKAVNGCGMLKPFPLEELLETIQFLEKRGRFVASPAPRPERVVAAAAIPAPPVFYPPPVHVFITVPEEPAEESARTRRIPAGVALFFGAASLAGLVLGAMRWHGALHEQAAISSGELLALERQWEDATKQLRDVETARAGIEALLKRPDRLAADRAAPRWAGALRDVAKAAGPGIELLDLRAKGGADDPGACELRVAGISTGATPRVIADAFLHALSGNLESHAARGTVSVRFESLEDVPHSAATPPHGRQAKFTIVAKSGSNVALSTNRSERR